MIDPFQNLHVGVASIEDPSESIVTFFRGFLAMLRASTADANVLALAERAQASLDGFAKSILANTSAAQKDAPPPSDEEKAKEEEDKKAIAGKEAPAHDFGATDDEPSDPEEEEPKKRKRGRPPKNQEPERKFGDNPNLPPFPSPSSNTPTTGAPGGAEHAPSQPMAPNLSATTAPTEANTASPGSARRS